MDGELQRVGWPARWRYGAGYRAVLRCRRQKQRSRALKVVKVAVGGQQHVDPAPCKWKLSSARDEEEVRGCIRSGKRQ